MNNTKKIVEQNITRKHACSIAALLVLFLAAISQSNAQIPGEFATGSFPTGNGPLTTAQSGKVQLNPSGTTYTLPNTVVNIGASFSNQQRTGSGTGAGNPVLIFGATNTTGSGTVTPRPTFATMNDIGAPLNNQFSNRADGMATGIDVGFNQAFNMYTSVRQWAGLTSPSTNNSRIYMGDMTLTFSTPIKNPLLHVVGMGGTGASGLGFTTELDLITPGVTLAKIQGNGALSVSATQINNANANGNTNAITASCSGGGAACGTIQVTGSGITSITFRVYVRGDGGATNWGSTANHSGDQWLMGFSMPETFTVAGNVFNDANGLSDSTVNGAGAAAYGGVQLYANLVDVSNGQVLGSMLLGASGDYSFNGIPAGANLRVEISTLAGTALSSSPARQLPSDWVNTGENIGTSAGSDGTADGIININNVVANVPNANFGIEQRPGANTNTAANQTNPGGTDSAAVPATTFSATDGTPGTVANIRITGFPINATTITINGMQFSTANFPAGGVTVPTNTSGNPTQPILVDPIDGATTVAISYVAIDNADVVSSLAATANIPFVLVLNGTVLNDVNGLTDNIVNGTGTNAGGSLYVNLLNSGNVVVQSLLLPASGVYSFSSLNAGSYTVQVSTNQGTVGSAAPATAMPRGWVNTGEFVGIVAGNDGSANGLLPVSIVSAGVSNANFGIEQRPTSNDKTTTSQTNPGGTNNVIVPAATFTGNDESGGVVSSIRITAFPSNATSLTVETTTYYPNAAAIPGTCPTSVCAAFPTNGVTIPNTPAQTIKVDPIDGAVTVAILFVVIDDANVESTATATASVPFATVAIGGTVFDDVNGLTDNTVNGTVPNTGMTLYANLLDNDGIVLRSDIIPTVTGVYSFANLNSGNYTVQISTNPGTVGSAMPITALPSSWVNTGEFIGTGTGNDGVDNGLLPVSVAAVSIANANFGIEQRPVANNNTAESQNNPGGTNNATVPPSVFTATDSGTVSSIRITEFPSNATTIITNGMEYTAGNFPMGGVTIPTNAAGNPLQEFLIDPVEGAVTIVIRYVAIDNAGVVSSNDASAAAANVPFVLAPTAANGEISGILSFGRNPIPNVLVVLHDTNSNSKVFTRTDSDGKYFFKEKAVGETYVIQPLSSKYVFSSANSVVDLFDNATNVNFDSSTKTYHPKNDFDGDGKSDLAVFRPSDGNWYVLKSSDEQMSVFNFGFGTDIPVSADFDGDGKTDYAVFRPSEGNWYIWQSKTQSLRVEKFGLSDDKLIPSDYDGDGKADIAVYRNGFWYIRRSSDDFVESKNFGLSMDIPVTEDFDGDGKTDLSLFRPSDGTWYKLLSLNNNFSAEKFGLVKDVPVSGDFDGDGFADIAQFRKGYWYILNSTTNFEASQFGSGKDKSLVGDYDGDGRADVTIYRNGFWLIRNSGDGTVRKVYFGLSADTIVK